MWLINTKSYKLEEFSGQIIPRYAILSHTWDTEEISFQQMWSRFIKHKKSFDKIKGTCRLALANNIDYVWIDTCCIDKTSSADLSEAVNSMFELYRNSFVCYAFLSDLDPSTKTDLDLPRCRWFTRGWTLQELIAPSDMRFYDSAWHFRGTRSDLLDMISEITHIDTAYLRSSPALLDQLRLTHAAVKISWMSYRSTTRVEDMAYCLLGLFNINMPLLYGEGSRAFRRLQEEVLKRDGDLSLLAWKPRGSQVKFSGILAKSASEFAWIHSMKMSFSVFVNRKECDFISKGLRHRTRLLKVPLNKVNSAASLPFFRLVLDLDCWADIKDVTMGEGWRSSASNGTRVSFGVHLRKHGTSSYCRDVTSHDDGLVILNPFQPVPKCPVETTLIHVDRDFLPNCYLTEFPLGSPWGNNVHKEIIHQIAIYFPKQPDLDIIDISDRSSWDASNRMLLCDYYKVPVVMTVRPSKAENMSDMVLIINSLNMCSEAKIAMLDARSDQAQYLLDSISKIDDVGFLGSSDLGLKFGQYQIARTIDKKWDFTLSTSIEIVAEISRSWKVLRVELGISPVSIESKTNDQSFLGPLP